MRSSFIVLAVLCLSCEAEEKTPSASSTPAVSAAPAPVEPAAPKEASKAEKEGLKADMKALPQVSSVDLYKEYQANEVTADQKHNGKVVLLGGPINSIDKSAFGSMILRLRGDTQLESVVATIEESEKAKVVALEKDQVVLLRCTITGMVLGSPTAKDCTILNVGEKAPSGAP